MRPNYKKGMKTEDLNVLDSSPDLFIEVSVLWKRLQRPPFIECLALLVWWSFFSLSPCPCLRIWTPSPILLFVSGFGWSCFCLRIVVCVCVCVRVRGVHACIHEWGVYVCAWVAGWVCVGVWGICVCVCESGRLCMVVHIQSCTILETRSQEHINVIRSKGLLGGLVAVAALDASGCEDRNKKSKRRAWEVSVHCG